MQNGLKPSGAKATDLFNKQFHHSRLILTVMYVAILAVILFSSGSITHLLFSQRLDDRFSRFEIFVDGRTERLPPLRAKDVQEDLQQATIVVNSFLLFVAGGLSYWLAGLTLRPIQIAYNKQREFLSDASHELRTPLTILQTNLENELDAAKSSDIRVVTESHLEEVGRMSRLVDNLLTLSRLDNNENNLKKNETVDLLTVVKETVERLQSIAKKHSVTLVLVQDGAPRASPWYPPSLRGGATAGLSALGRHPVRSPEVNRRAKADKNSVFPVSTSKDLLTRAVTNVINNAIIYNKEAGRVEVFVEIKGCTGIVKVVDTGIGIAKEEIEKVFDRFYRAEKSRSRQTGGSGLGLSIVQSIVDSLGGSVVLESELGKGTTVMISLPIHKAS